ncbi:MAG: tetratricopeptide repeat protein, partial [Proteobacteria bacterium]|nr:tetratricopeptide repeat protein [Pseudomonadota bacterium]
VRKAGSRLRITAQLIDGKSGEHLWAEKYDRGLDDIFKVQDEVTEKIVDALKVTLTATEKERFGSVRTSNMEAYDLVLRARDQYLQTTQESFSEARELLTRAIELDDYARAYSQLAQVCLTQRYHGWSPSPAEDVQYAFGLASRAVELDPELPFAHSILGSAYLWRDDIERAAAEAERTLELDPNGADGFEGIAEIKFVMGCPEEALSLLDRAMRLNPHFPFYYLSIAGFSHLILRNFEEAASTFERGTVRHPDFAPHHLHLAACHGHLGNREKAAQAFSRAESMGISLDQFSEILLARDPGTRELVLDGLRAAGLIT